MRRHHKGNHCKSPKHDENIHKEVAYHLGCMKHMLESDELGENDIGNADETHFVISMDDGITLGFCGDK